MARTGSQRVLSPAPTELDGSSDMPIGAFEGLAREIAVQTAAGLPGKRHLTDFLRHKHWMYVFAASEDLLVTAAIVDAGPTGTTWITVADRRSGVLLADISRPGGLRPMVSLNNFTGDGHSSRYRMPGTDVRFESPGGSGQLHVRVRIGRPIGVPVLGAPDLEVDLWFDLTDPTPGITVAAELDTSPPMVSSTAKRACLPVSGRVTMRGSGTKTIELHDGLGGYDFTNGNLPRHTKWRWAYGTGPLADGRRIGFNLTSGFTGIGPQAQENVLWLDGSVSPLDTDAHIDHLPADPWTPWAVSTADGGLELTFTPLEVHRESLNLGVVRSRFLQPVGTFDGVIKANGKMITVTGLPGVVENQDVLW